MSKQPEDLTTHILRQIQAMLADHTKRFDRVDEKFERIERRLDDLHDGMIAALGLAHHAQIRHDAVDKRLNQLKAQIERLAKKR